MEMLIKSGADPNIKNRQLSYDYDSDGEIMGLDAYELCEGDKQVSVKCPLIYVVGLRLFCSLRI